MHLFNLSFKTGFVPPQMKCAKVIPIYKLDNYDLDEASQFTNYRPISLLSAFSKLLERVAARQMFKYINKYDILYKNQYGFRPKHKGSSSFSMNSDHFVSGIFFCKKVF